MNLKNEFLEISYKYKAKELTLFNRERYKHELYKLFQSYDLLDLKYKININLDNDSFDIIPIRTIDKYIFNYLLNE